MLKVIIVDDERPALEKMSKLLLETGAVEIIGLFIRSPDALEFLAKNSVDAVFLDIEMPDMDGIELASRMTDIQEKTSVVFVTAYNEYAVEAFRLNALDYLTKPVSAERLTETIRRLNGLKHSGVQAEDFKISCFGRFTLVSGQQVVRFRTQKAEELLAFMIDKRGETVSRSEILDSLWAEFDGERSLIHFNTTLHNVKKALYQYGVSLPFTYDRGSYRFETDSLNCDYLKFSSFTDKSKSPSRGNILEFEEAARLFKGEYLTGWDCNWAAIKRMCLTEKYFDLISSIAEYYEGTGDYQKAAKWLKTGLLIEPLHRDLNYKLVEAMLSANEKSLAKKYFEIYKTGLMLNLGQAPDEAFRAFRIL